MASRPEKPLHLEKGMQYHDPGWTDECSFPDVVIRLATATTTNGMKISAYERHAVLRQAGKRGTRRNKLERLHR